MREILFRGKRTDNGEWVEGALDNFDKASTRILSKNRRSLWNISVIPETIGQFAGITDDNGKKIFEGDIVKTHYANARTKAEFIEEVVFRGCRFCAKTKLSGGGSVYSPLFDGTPHFSADKTVYMDRVEIIGNKYDNPELLAEREATE